MSEREMEDYRRWYEAWRWNYWNDKARALRQRRNRKQRSARSRRR